jgi:hypothetical protein
MKTTSLALSVNSAFFDFLEPLLISAACGEPGE